MTNNSERYLNKRKDNIFSFSQMQNSTAGLTLIEVIISVAVLVLLVGIVASVFLSFDRHQALERDTAKVISELERARQLTLFSKDASQYGLHLESSEVVLFKGDTYQVGALDNSRTSLHSKVTISAHSLNGGGDDIVFERLTGETNQNGTITLQSKIEPFATTTISIEKTGLVK